MKARIVWSLVVSFFMVACVNQSAVNSNNAESNLAQDPDTRLYIFDCGRLDYTDISAFGVKNEETPVRSLFVPCYLIEHKDKRVLWDAGLPLNMAGTSPIPMPAHHITISYEVSLTDQLAAMNLAPSDVDYLVLSHMHFDHAGAANAFKDSIWVVQKPEYDMAFAEGENPLTAFKQIYSELESSEKLMLEGDYDLFGDGVFNIISAPGHTPGHQVLLLDLPNTGKILFSGDLYHMNFSRAFRRMPNWNTSPEDTLASMDKVERLIKDTGAKLWIEHDLALAESLKLAPAYYD